MNLNLRKTATEKVTLSELTRFISGSVHMMWDEGLLDEILSKMLLGFERAQEAWEVEDRTYEIFEYVISTLRSKLAHDDHREKVLAINLAMMYLHENLRECDYEDPESPYAFWQYVLSGDPETLLNFFDASGFVRGW